MRRITLSSGFVKLFALIAMTADHCDKIIGGSATWISDTIGRTALPLFAYLIISNFCAYHPFKKYVLRLGFFGVLAGLVFYFFQGDPKNILFTFLWAIIYLQGCEYVCTHVKSPVWQAYWLGLFFLILMPFAIISDYNLLGFLFLMALYAYCRFPGKVNYLAVMITAATLNFYDVTAVVSTLLTVWGLLSVFHISAGRRLVKWWVFYIYYPLHLLLLYTLRELM